MSMKQVSSRDHFWTLLHACIEREDVEHSLRGNKEIDKKEKESAENPDQSRTFQPQTTYSKGQIGKRKEKRKQKGTQAKPTTTSSPQ